MAATKARASASATQTPPPVDDEFEPFSRWHREEKSDTLEVHVPEFKKEELRVQLTSPGMIKISGERQVDATKRSRFYKEVRVPKDCNANGIHAKFISGRLHVIMPKKTIEENQPVTTQQLQPDKSPVPETGEDQATMKAATSPESGKAKEKMNMPPSQDEAPRDGNSFTKSDIQQEQSGTRLKKFNKVAVSIAAMVAAAVVIGAYVKYMYKSLDDMLM
ncbi:unnamed protein product [Ilex paraguariensis]|uniref:SHSP domain-containing protein n=1 Tax=Ilex paraguariensis TaxID=185542 RepID=A0ABC8QQL9_9AQUA